LKRNSCLFPARGESALFLAEGVGCQKSTGAYESLLPTFAQGVRRKDTHTHTHTARGPATLCTTREKPHSDKMESVL
jgi:hypothetical protein